MRSSTSSRRERRFLLQRFRQRTSSAGAAFPRLPIQASRAAYVSVTYGAGGTPAAVSRARIKVRLRDAHLTRRRRVRKSPRCSIRSAMPGWNVPALPATPKEELLVRQRAASPYQRARQFIHSVPVLSGCGIPGKARRSLRSGPIPQSQTQVDAGVELPRRSCSFSRVTTFRRQGTRDRDRGAIIAGIMPSRICRKSSASPDVRRSIPEGY
jgi:hypothetical protein